MLEKKVVLITSYHQLQSIWELGIEGGDCSGGRRGCGSVPRSVRQQICEHLLMDGELLHDLECGGLAWGSCVWVIHVVIGI